jgi:hypothetical protein
MKMGSIQYDKKVLAFLDILGFERIVNESRNNPELIGRIARILTRSRDVALSSSKISPKVLRVDPSQYMHRAFSDTSVISGPYTSHDDMNFLSWWVMSYQYLMWKEERTFLRGAIVYGGIYEDADIIFGPALIDAYNLERDKKKADWPRVLIDKSLLDKASETERTSDFLEFLRQDEDNLAYLDYLRELFHLFVLAENKRIIGERGKDFGLPVSLFKDHREAILVQRKNVLKEKHRDEGKEILRKYVELSKYHNSTINRFRQITRDLANNNGLVCEFFEDQIKSDKAKKIGAVYKPKYSAEEHPEQSDMLNILVAVLNRVIENPPPDILKASDIVIIGQTANLELNRAISTLSREAPRELSSFDKALEESMIDIDKLSTSV